MPTTTIKAVLCPSHDSTCKACPYDPSKDYIGFILAACDSNYEITEFRIALYRKDWKSDEIKVQGNTANPQAKVLLNKAEKGDTVLFYCIKARDKKEKDFILQPLTIHL